MADIVIVSPHPSKQRILGNLKLNSSGLNGENKRHDSGIKCQVDLGSGNTECRVQNCSTNFLTPINKSQVTFVTFPKDPSRFTEWTRAIGRQDLICYIGKKEATNFLLCSKHFSEDMWVNSNTRLKRLHKNAVPEICSDDEVDVLVVNPASERIPARKSGLKIKKVSSLLTETALKESPAFSPSAMDTSVSILRASPINSFNNKSLRKWPPLLHQPKQTSSTDLEKKLVSENAQLKSELDKNMDYILNQKAHYEGILLKEKRKSEELESKIEVLENAQRKLWHTYESQLQAQRTVVNTKEVGRKEMITRMKALESTNDSFEKRLGEAYRKVNDLQTANRGLEMKVAEMSREAHPLPPPPDPDFTGEHFKSFLSHYLRQETLLQKRVEELSADLETHETSEGQETQLLNLAARRLNHMQMSWLEVALKGEDASMEFQEHMKEFCLSLHEASEDAYVIFAKTLGLPPRATVRTWLREPSGLGLSTVNSSINALFEEGSPSPAGLTTVSPEKRVGKSRGRWGRERSPPLKRKCYVGEDDEEDEEGRASDEEEEVVFSEDSEEEEGEGGKEETKLEQSAAQEPFEVGVATTAAAEAAQPDFDFILEEEEVTTQQEEEDSTSGQVGNSMPLLVPDSPMTPMPSLDGAPQPHPAPSEPKISNRKKVITSDSSLPSGPKVVFRVIES